MGHRSKRVFRRAMQATAVMAALLVIAAVSGLLRWRAQTAPPEEDIRATMRTIEAEAYAGAAHDPAVFERLEELASRAPSNYANRWIESVYTVPSTGETRSGTETPASVVMNTLSVTPRFRVSREALDEARAAFRTDAFLALTDELETLLDDPGCRPPDLHDSDERIYLVVLLHIAHIRGLADAQLAGVAVALHDGREADALRHASLTLRLARLLGRQPLITPMLVGIAIESHTLGWMTSCARTPGATASLLAGLEDLLREHDRLDDGIALTLRGERCSMIDSLTGAYALEDHRADPIDVMFSLASLRDGAASLTALIDRFEEDAQTPAHERSAMPDGPHAYASSLSDDHRAALNMFKALDSSIENATSIRHQRNAVRLFVALRRYALEHGAPPSELGELVGAGLLDAVPEDTMAPDGRFRYEFFGAMPLGFLLYSVGPDHTDNMWNVPEKHNHRSHVYGVPNGYDYPIEPGF